MLSFFPRDVLDEILNLIESVSEGFPSYSFMFIVFIFLANYVNLFSQIYFFVLKFGIIVSASWMTFPLQPWLSLLSCQYLNSWWPYAYSAAANLCLFNKSCFPSSEL